MTTNVLCEFYQAKRAAVNAIHKFKDDKGDFREKLRLELKQAKVKLRERLGLKQKNRGFGERLRGWMTRKGDSGQVRRRLKRISIGERIKGWMPKDPRILNLLFLIATFVLIQSIGTVFYAVFSLKYSTYAEATGTYVGIVVQGVLLLVLLSRWLRAILFVAIPTLVTSRLRAIIVIMMLIWAFQFPAQNVTRNIQQAMEGVNCVNQRIKAAAAEVKRRAGKNFHEEPVEKLRTFLKQQSKPIEAIREQMRKLDDSLTRMLAWQRSLIKRIRGLMGNCSTLADFPFQACVGWLSERHTDCMNRYFEFMCKPIEWAKHLCYLTKILHLHCKWPSKVKNTVKEGVSYFVKGAKKKISAYVKESFMYDMYNRTFKEGKRTWDTLQVVVDRTNNYTEDIQTEKDLIHKELHKEIETYEKFLNYMVFFLDLLMFLMLAWPFLMAILYVRNFVKNDSTDNVYINKSFEEIDEARALTGQPTLLPLLPKESKRYIRVTSIELTFREKMMMILANVFLIFSMVPIVLFIVVDIFTYKLIKRAFIFFHGNGTIFPTPNIYRIKVSGDGFLNQLLGSILHTFEPLTDSKERDQMWRQCFLEPSPPNYELFQIILLLYFLCVLTTRVQAYLGRARHAIAQHYFPRRAQPRALFLYNKILTARMEMFDTLWKIQRTTKEGDEDDEREKRLLFKGMVALSDAKQRCFNCARTDLSIQEMSKIRLCVRCHTTYCVDCFTLRKRCRRKECRAPLQEIKEDVELYVDSSCEDQTATEWLEDTCYTKEMETVEKKEEEDKKEE